MRRRSERRKSTEVNSPAVAATARRSGRRRKSSEKNAEDYNEIAEEAADNTNRASSEEPEVATEKSSRRGRRKRTPVSSPSKRKNRRTESPESKIEAIPEEENNGTANDDNNAAAQSNIADEGHQIEKIDKPNDDNERYETMETPRETGAKDACDGSMDDVKAVSKEHAEEVTAELVSEDVKQKEVIGNSRSLSPKAIVDEKPAKASISDVLDIKEESQQDQEPADAHRKHEVYNERQVEDAHKQEATNKIVEKPKKPITMLTEDSRDSEYNGNQQLVTKSPVRVSKDLDSNENSIQMDTNLTEQEKSLDVNNSQMAQNASSNNNVRIQRKRKWLTKKAVESSKTPILAISTDSLKGLISDVHPVPLSDVRLDSSPEVEEVASEREEGEKTPSPKPREDRSSIEKMLTIEKPIIKRTISRDPIVPVPVATVGATAVKVQRSPSPARNKTSNVLYITNLVRPFTVMQLKSLLARTGKIVEDGFWIDRIKSKCYVQYETEDEAIETRHALHGVRWPVSNPKCLNVDFGKKADMDRAIETTKDDAPKLGQDSKDNVIVGSGWTRGERTDEVDRKSTRPVREWDVGKRDTLDREREKNREVVKRRSRERDVSSNRENEKSSSDRKARNRSRDRRDRTRSASPVRKVQKKENEPPLRLLDDLFRKTKATPCIYWLPLTPEQIAEKEALRQKRINDRQERVKQLELEREKEREKERENRNRGNDRDKDRDRDRDRDRRNRSSDRRRSRSRDRRRY